MRANNLGLIELTQAQTKLEQIQSIASIASSIAIPLVLAVGGYFVQREIADDGIKKDYVAMATGILREDARLQDPALRLWAVEIVSAFAPIKLSPQAEVGFRTWAIPELPDSARQLPLPDFCKPSCSEAVRRQQDKARKELEKLLEEPER